MKSLAAFSLVALLAITGCRKEQVEQTAAAEELKLFEKGKGLRLPEQTCQMIGVETVEVAEKKFQRTLEVTAQVYERTERSLRAVATLRSDEAKFLKAGAKMALLGSAGPSNTVSGTLLRLENLGSQAEAVLEFPNRDRLDVGSFFRVQFTAAEAHTALAVPSDSVIHGAEGPFVYAVNGTHFTRTPVKVGVIANGFTEIVDGLYAGDSVAGKATEPMWMIELYALKGGTPCCPVPKKNTAVN